MFREACKNTCAPLLLRLALAALFLTHGLLKVFQDFGTNWTTQMEPLHQALVAWSELAIGLALLIGFLTRLAALGCAAIMIGAMLTMGWQGDAIKFEPGPAKKKGFDYVELAFQKEMTVLVLGLGVALLGAGTLSLDHKLFGPRTPPAGEKTS